MGLILTLIVFVGGALLLGARSRIAELERRLRLVEDELRRRIAAGAMPRIESAAAPVEAPAPTVAEIIPPQPEAPAAVASGPEVEAAPPSRPAPIVETLPAMAWEMPAEPAVEAPTDPLPAQAAEPEPAPASVPAPAMRRAAINFEELFGRKLPIWAGGITLAIAGVLIVKYAIDQGIFARIFTPGVQAVCGMLFGFGLIGAAEWAWRAREKVADPRVSQALSGAGISTLYAALLVAANLYHLISPLAAFAGLALVTGGALWLSLRHGMPSAVLGLAGGLAAPALTVGLDANVPMLAVYLGFTIAGLAGVARAQRWPWLALLALLGGAGWSLWLILAGRALETVGALSIGGFVMLLALVLPLFAFAGAAQRLLRATAAVIGAAQLGLLVALGGFMPLHWGLFALIAAAGQFLAWRERELAIVPTLSAALSFILLMLWPHPATGWLLTMGLALAAIHAGPLLARLWQAPARLQRAIELAGIAVAAPLLALRHADDVWTGYSLPVALCALGGALLVLGAAALGWRAPDRRDDRRFALLLATGGGLLMTAAWFALAHWQAPLWTMLVALAMLALSAKADDNRIEPIAATFGTLALVQLVATFVPAPLAEPNALVEGVGAGAGLTSLLRWAGLAPGFALFAWKARSGDLRRCAWLLTGLFAYGALAQRMPGWTLPIIASAVAVALFAALRRREQAHDEALMLPFAAAAVLLLGVTGTHPADEWARLTGGSDAPASVLALLRWSALLAPALLLALRARIEALRLTGEVAAVLAGYGALAQVTPPIVLPLVPPLGLIALAGSSRALPWPALRAAGATLVGLVFGWAFMPLVQWSDHALRSLAGVPMLLDHPDLGTLAIIRRLAIPALLMGGAAWLQRTRLPRFPLVNLIVLGGVIGGVALHGLYRHLFAALFGTDFVTTGLLERLIWSGILLGAGWLLLRRWNDPAAPSIPAAVLTAAAGLHGLWYSLLLHNPLWNAQHVGGLPALNLLIPLFGLLPLALYQLAQALPAAGRIIDRTMQPVLMLTVAGFAWASLRQAFHGTSLVDPGVGPAEDILRSILGIALAIGFLLWGIRRKRHDWRIASLVLMLAAVVKVFLFDASGLEGLLRIASFVALGFSLIGIGWLYSRQLRRGDG